MKLHSLSFFLLVLFTLVQAQQSSFTIAGIKPYDKVVPGQVMDVLIDGLSSGATPAIIPVTDFRVEVSQDGVTQTATVRLSRFTMIQETQSSKRNTIEFGGMKMRPYQAVSFVVPKGLHPGPAEVIVSYRGERGNSVPLEINEKPLRPVVGTMAVVAVGGMPPDRTTPIKPEGNDLNWKLDDVRATAAPINSQPMLAR